MEKSCFWVPDISTLEKFVYGNGNPVVAITAGIHGEEHTGIHVAHRLMEYLSLAELKGTVIVLPICNPGAFAHRSRVSPYDRLDLNRSFGINGSPSYTISLAKAITDALSDAQWLLDLHCCGVNGSLYVMCMHKSMEEQRSMAKGLGIPNVVQSSEAEGQLFVNFNRQGKKALLIEMPGGQPTGYVDLAVSDRVFESALAFLDMAEVIDYKDALREDIFFHEKIKRVNATHFGMFIPLMPSGSKCCEGEIVGKMGLQEFKAPVDGTLLAIEGPRYIFAGERVFTIAPFEKA